MTATDGGASGGGAAATPSVIVLDVNETLSDLSPLRARFVEVGAEESLAATWFSSVLRDGIALATTGEMAGFAEIGGALLGAMLPASLSGGARDGAVAHVLDGFTSLPVHADVPDGLRALHALGLRVVTLSNGASSVADGLLERAGVGVGPGEVVEATLSVADAGVWKPAAPAYSHAVAHTGEPAERHLLVAVHPWDVHGSRRAGLGGAWIDRSETAAYPGFFARPTHRAPDLVELARVLEQEREPRA